MVFGEQCRSLLLLRVAMPQSKNITLLEVNKVELDAVNLINREVALAGASEQVNHPQPTVSVKEGRRQARKPYGDESVPRIRQERRFGGSSHSRAYFKQDLCLYSDRAQLVFERNYENVNQSLIISTLVVDAMGGSELSDKVSTHISSLFQVMEQELMQAITELKRVSDMRKIPAEKQVPAYDHKRFYNPPIHTPQSIQFTNLITLFDRLIARTEGCWLNHLMDTPTYKTVISTWERKIRQFINQLYNIRREALAEARNTGYGRRADQIEVEVRRQQREEKMESRDVATTGAAAAAAELAATDAVDQEAGNAVSEAPVSAEQKENAPSEQTPATEQTPAPSTGPVPSPVLDPAPGPAPLPETTAVGTEPVSLPSVAASPQAE